MALTQQFRVSSSGQMSLPAAARRRWHLDRGGKVDVVDLGFGVLTLPAGASQRLLNDILPADVHYANVATDEDDDLTTS
jgi:bifunctional DNA-binding transcriptional regulator/antitoxin component of YhaV-PrlF toxin-antitoxin module